MKKRKINGDTLDMMLMKPKIDFAFKLLFGSNNDRSKVLLINLLNAVLGAKGHQKISAIVHLDPYINKEYADDKMSIMDIEVRTDAGELIDIEMQISNIDDYRKRSLYYWAKLYAKDMTEGKSYRQLKKCIVISIMNFCLLKETNKYHSVFAVKETEDGYKLNDDLELHYLELPKLIERENINSMNDLEKWLIFIKDAGEKGKEEVIQKLRKESEVIDMAAKMLEQMSEDERIRQIYFYREKLAMDKASQEAYLREIKAEAAKAQEEKAKAQEEAAKERDRVRKSVIKFKELGLPISEIAEITGLSVEEIEKINYSSINRGA